MSEFPPNVCRGGWREGGGTRSRVSQCVFFTLSRNNAISLNKRRCFLFACPDQIKADKGNHGSSHRVIDTRPNCDCSNGFHGNSGRFRFSSSYRVVSSCSNSAKGPAGVFGFTVGNFADSYGFSFGELIPRKFYRRFQHGRIDSSRLVEYFLRLVNLSTTESRITFSRLGSEVISDRRGFAIYLVSRAICESFSPETLLDSVFASCRATMCGDCSVH